MCRLHRELLGGDIDMAISQLVDQGILVRRDDGTYIVRPGVAQAAPYRERLEQWTAETLRSFNDCLEQGIFKVEEAAR